MKLLLRTVARRVAKWADPKAVAQSFIKWLELIDRRYTMEAPFKCMCFRICFVWREPKDIVLFWKRCWGDCVCLSLWVGVCVWGGKGRLHNDLQPCSTGLSQKRLPVISATGPVRNSTVVLLRYVFYASFCMAVSHHQNLSFCYLTHFCYLLRGWVKQWRLIIALSSVPDRAVWEDAGLVSDAADPVCCGGTEEAAQPGVGLQVWRWLHLFIFTSHLISRPRVAHAYGKSTRQSRLRRLGVGDW